MKKPRFDLSELGGSKSLSKCKDFLPKLRDSNAALARAISGGDLSSVVDSDIRVYRGSHVPDPVADERAEDAIVLDVGVGVFDVNNPKVDDDALRTAGVTTVTLDPRCEVRFLTV
ncbi:calmodulin 3 [Babesia caballi]|uniref:Calmodulin 3 n=1 Tax=Babesia caballi TaxID=5871 RepID=A0AAV4M235_BABCB|nr:calmodulin 3 [Babesia caballi]